MYSLIYKVPKIIIDVTYLIAFIIAIAIIIGFALFAYRAFIKRLIIEKEIQFEQKLKHQREISKQRSSVQEKERRLIAKRLHDDVGSQLNILQLWINNEATWQTGKTKEIIEKSLPKIILDVRNISHKLYPVVLESLGFTSALEEISENLTSIIKVDIVISPKYTGRDLDIELQLYRIAQEFISNSIKHSDASLISIKLRDSFRGLTFLLSDNGKGFKTSDINSGMGLKNIKNRIQIIQAHHKLTSSVEKGTRLIIFIKNEKGQN